jgi:hypothetical protein
MTPSVYRYVTDTRVPVPNVLSACIFKVVFVSVCRSISRVLAKTRELAILFLFLSQNTDVATLSANSANFLFTAFDTLALHSPSARGTFPSRAWTLIEHGANSIVEGASVGALL